MTKIIKAKSMLELIRKVYAAEGWVHTVGQNKTKRIQTQYLIDVTDNWWVAKRKGDYFTLVTNEDGTQWAPQFGDWDKKVVQEESKESSYRHLKSAAKKIIATDGTPEALAAVIATLNAGE